MAKIDRAAKVQLLADFDAQYAAFVTAGMDEAGRGPLVGNVVAACVVMPKEPLILWVDDSKKLSEKRRESVYAEIMERALYVGIGQATPEEIDRMNILEATKKAMREAASQVPAEVFLIDAVKDLGLNGREIPMVKGDATSYAIAASSIVAKVTRDRQMLELDKQYPQYGFARNKGYGTPEHIAAWHDGADAAVSRGGRRNRPRDAGRRRNCVRRGESASAEPRRAGDAGGHTREAAANLPRGDALPAGKRLHGCSRALRRGGNHPRRADSCKKCVYGKHVGNKNPIPNVQYRG